MLEPEQHEKLAKAGHAAEMPVSPRLSETIKPARIPCCVPFCRRTAPRAGKFERCAEIICGKHWRLARRSRRLTYGRLVREIDRDPRAFWTMGPGSRERLRRVKVERIADHLWSTIKAEAIERAMGISA